MLPLITTSVLLSFILWNCSIVLFVSGLKCYSGNSQLSIDRGNEMDCKMSHFCLKREGLQQGQLLTDFGCDGELTQPLFRQQSMMFRPGMMFGGGQQQQQEQCHGNICVPVQSAMGGIYNLCCCDTDLCNGSTGIFERSSLFLAIPSALVILQWLIR